MADPSAKSEPPIISLDNLEEQPIGATVNSPRSLDACKKEGIDPNDLIKKSLESFADKGVTEKVKEMRFKFHEKKRKEMLTTAIKARDKMIGRKRTTSNASIDAPREKPRTSAKYDTQTAPVSTRNSDKNTKTQIEKLMEQQNKSNVEQISFMLKAHERQDSNLKKNMEMVLNCIRKREEIEKMREEEYYKKLKEREEQHKLLLIEKNEKVKEEIERKKKKEQDISEEKKKFFEETDAHLKQKSITKVEKLQCTLTKLQAIEDNRKKMYMSKKQILEKQEELRKQKEEKLKEILEKREEKAAKRIERLQGEDLKLSLIHI
eukprot:TRINITY_DN15547_c0_g1_i2.p1 TRINITY_DN15547_c0_g1~~TRINITY_DN15547_c0_g1_i2.p1  ORF type:complete len:320 (+),score=111.91 TRINITY_DN15547_c0_g1_i2:115-1074(+)